MFIVFYGFQKTFFVETLLFLQSLNYLLIQKVWSLNYFVSLSTFHNCLRRCCLYLWRAYVKSLSLRFVKFVPWVVSNLCDWNSIRWVSYKDFLYHVFGIFRQVVWKSVLCVQYFLVQVWGFLVFKWKEATEHCVQHNSARPEVTHQAIVPVAGDHLRGSIARRATCCF